MGSLKRKLPEDSSAETRPAQRQQGESCSELVNGPVACVHDVSYPDGYVPSLLSSARQHSDPAKSFPFTLDPFQSEAINCLEKGESVMVYSLNTKS